MAAKTELPPTHCPECGAATTILRDPAFVQGMAERGVAICEASNCNWSEEEDWDYDLTPPPPPTSRRF